MATKADPIAAEITLDRSSTVSEAFQAYVRQLPQETKQAAQPEIGKFVRWVGGDRLIASLVPSEVGEYSDSHGARSTSPDALERLSTVKLFLTYMRKKQMIEVNLAQHIRLRKTRAGASKAQSITGKGPEIRLTKAGYNDMTKQLSQLQQQRVKLVDDIQRAAADGDVRENAPLEAARENQSMVVSKILEIEATLKYALILDESGEPTNRVTIGSKVKLTEVASERTIDYQLVEPNEASPLSGKISIVSPVGAAILGRRAGEEVTVKTPRGQQVYKIDTTT